MRMDAGVLLDLAWWLAAAVAVFVLWFLAGLGTWLALVSWHHHRDRIRRVR